MTSPIAGYAIVGDCRSAALISRTGSLDWLCWPTFDSPSLFAAILDGERGGRFSISPPQPFRSERAYWKGRTCSRPGSSPREAKSRSPTSCPWFK